MQNAYLLQYETFKNGAKVLICGNGGSAADADHWAGELLKGFRKKRPVPSNGLTAELAAHLQEGLPAIPLTGFPAASTAFCNDVRPDLVFAQLVWALGARGDLLVCISTSGNAKNVLAAAEAARGKGMKTIALTGAGGGALAPVCDISIRVPETETYRVQELHLPVYHTLSMMIEDSMFSE